MEYHAQNKLKEMLPYNSSTYNIRASADATESLITTDKLDHNKYFIANIIHYNCFRICNESIYCAACF